jgi:hypothetical protein
MADDDARSTRRGACEGKSRTRADSAQFSEMSDKRETGWWRMQSPANCSLIKLV